MRRLAAVATATVLGMTVGSCAEQATSRPASSCTPANFVDPACQTKEALTYRLARTELAELAAVYNEQRAECPTVEELRAETTVRGADPWGTAYAVTCSDDDFYVVSAGPDKKLGTSDDLRAWPPVPDVAPLEPTHRAQPCPTVGPCPQIAGEPAPLTRRAASQ